MWYLPTLRTARQTENSPVPDVHNAKRGSEPVAIRPNGPRVPASELSTRKTRTGVVVLLCFSSCFALAWGLVMARVAHGTIPDFKVVYYGARCIVQHQDPYNQTELLRVYRAEDGEAVSPVAGGQHMQVAAAVQTYLPSGVLFIAPFGLLPWPAAYTLWILLTIVGITTAAALMWSVANRYAPGPAFYLISFILFNSGILFAGGNPAGAAVSLCVIAAWCFVRDRYVDLGIVCLATSLAIKPHDAGFVWLYFLIAGAATRKPALKSLLLTAIIGVVALLWVRQVSPHWFAELQHNVQEYSARGGYNDPGPVGNKTVGAGMVIDLQTVTSLVRDEPGFYRPAAYLLCAPLLAFWVFLTMRSHFSKTRAWFGLAAIAPLTLLPVYHRPYDAKLLILAVPACVMLCSAGRVHAWFSIALTGMAIVFTSDMPLAVLSIVSKTVQVPTGMTGPAINLMLTRPAPLALFALAVFNLFQYARICRNQAEDSAFDASSLVSMPTNPK
jgi:hypothetical protein